MVPGDRKYTQEHEWILVDGSNGTVGVTEFAAHELGDIVFVELPAVGASFKKGDAVALFYPSANRDEEVFEDPYSFKIDRNPNRHIGFGVGEHFCLGAHLARLEMVVAYRHLLPRIEEIELSGKVDRLHSGLVGGVKRLPIHYKLRRA